MSFATSKKLMEEGDTVLLYLGYDNFVQMQLARGHVHQTRFGAIKHDHLIGAPYGLKVECPKGWVYPLQPTAELWTLALPHRTQILYSPDISMIVFELHLKPGSIVVEAGTGSGSLSHALIRSVMPTGRLHTFEFHAERCAAANKEFEQHGLADYVIARHRDVCAQGFELDCEADAVFLDLPAPWECVTSAKRALKPGGRICTFSPCIEQVQRTCNVLKDHGFSDLSTVECLARSFSVQNVKLAQVNFGDEVNDKTEMQQTVSKVTQSPDNSSVTGSENPSKAARTETDSKERETKMDVEEQTNTDCVSSKGCEMTVSRRDQSAQTVEKARELKTGAPPLVMQGHTGFLTFASSY